jgi:hypothetical protein
MPKVTCPSGLEFEARTWNNEDTLVNLDSDVVEGGLVALKMVDRAMGRIVDPGPYPSFEAGGRANLAMVTNADISAAAVQIRAETRAIHSFDVPCEGCAKAAELELDLREVEMLKASDEGIEHIRTGLPVLREIGGVTIAVKLIRGADIPKMAKVQAKDQKAIVETQICMSLAYIRDPKYRGGMEISKFEELRRYWKGANWDFTDAVETAIDEIEGGPDLYIEHTCKRLGCHREQVTMLPLDMGFFGLDHMRRYRRQKRRKKQQSSSSTHDSNETTSQEEPTTS